MLIKRRGEWRRKGKEITTWQVSRTIQHMHRRSLVKPHPTHTRHWWRGTGLPAPDYLNWESYGGDDETRPFKVLTFPVNQIYQVLHLPERGGNSDILPTLISK